MWARFPSDCGGRQIAGLPAEDGFQILIRGCSMLTREMKDAIERADLFPVATASNTGVPNVVPVKYLHVAADDLIWITDNYLRKTLANLRENPQVAIYVWSSEPKMCFQIKGTVEIETQGADYERMKALVRQKKADLPARSLVVMHISEIYECLPGENAGKRLSPGT
jgi:predicted pyridoxine 5'-phosphate oxidase superfamily flavin-nucleotide-binding protein